MKGDRAMNPRCWKLFTTMLCLSAFTFGGGFVIIPLMQRRFSEELGWLTEEEILDMVWGRDYFGELKIVDVNIRRLRLKIEDNVQNPAYITTVWGYGYKWGL